ncbi:MAG: DUF4185 domain-containing protein, partial [bacterium]
MIKGDGRSTRISMCFGHLSPKKIRVKAVRDLGPQFVDNPHEMIGQDGAYSIPLNRESLWFFGDTLIGQRVPGESLWYPGGQPVGPYDMSGKGSIKRMINNSGLILKDKTGRYGLKSYQYICDDQGNIRPLIPRLPDEHPDEIRIWCLHGCYLQDMVYLYFVKVRMLESGPFPVNFEILGSGLAVGNRKQLRFERVVYEGSTLLWKHDEPRFGTAVLVDSKEEWIYVYGVIQDAAKVQKCYLARVKPNQIENREQYTYLTSPEPRWSPHIREAISVMQGMPNEMSVSFNPYLDCYLAVHSLDLTGKIVARTAPKPWGPWSDPVVLHTVIVHREKPLPYPPLVYAGKEHPELSEAEGSTIY